MNYSKKPKEIKVTVDKYGIYTSPINGRIYSTKREAIDDLMRMQEGKYDEWNNDKGYYWPKQRSEDIDHIINAPSIPKKKNKPRPKPNIKKIDSFIDWREAA